MSYQPSSAGFSQLRKLKLGLLPNTATLSLLSPPALHSHRSKHSTLPMLPTSPSTSPSLGVSTMSAVAKAAGLAFNVSLFLLGCTPELTMRLVAGEGHRDESLHQLQLKGRCTGRAEQMSDEAPNLPFLLEHKFTDTAGAAAFNNLQWYNQIITFVMVRVLLLSRIIQTEALASSCMLTA